MRAKLVGIMFVVLLAADVVLADTGRVAGRVVRPDGSGLGGVVVVINETSSATITDANGNYDFAGVPEGTYTVFFTAGNNALTEANVEVAGGTTKTIDKTLDWTMSFAESITVTSASRRIERIVEAPAAITTVSEDVIEDLASTGQLPKVIEGAPGVDFTQSGLYDFNFSSRGFNSSLNRRILTLIDGRDPAIAFLGAQEWAAISFPIDEMATVEMVRGPGSALYGANAFNGVLNMVTKQPRYTQGGKLQLTGGELSTQRVDARHAGTLASDWFYRVVGGWQNSDDFGRSRNVAVREYQGVVTTRTALCPAPPCTFLLPREAVPLVLDEVKTAYGGLRLDKYLGGGEVITIEGGMATIEGPVFQTGIGRVQVTDADRPWARLNFNTKNWNISTFYDARKAENQVALSSNAKLFEDSYNLQGEVQGNTDFASGKAQIIGGVSYRQQNVDTSNPAGVHTLMAESKEEDYQAAYAQLDYKVASNVRLVVAGRYDESSLHDSQFSPKGSLVWEFHPNQSLRFSYNEAFQVPNYSEFFLQAPAGAPVTALSALENALKPLLGGVSLGFTSIPVLALGNAALDVEEITGYEAGYTGIFGSKAFLTLDYYQNETTNFVTDLLPRVNPLFGAYAPPSQLPAAVQAQILGALRASLPASSFAAMTNLQNGSPAFVVSYANAGTVDTQGIEVALNYYITSRWVADFNYSWFDFEVKSGTTALGDVLLPNAPENKFNVGLAWRGTKAGVSVSYRWVDDFDWAVNIFKGPVESYGVANLSGNYQINDRFGLGATVSNLFDDEHWEAFGGDLIGRRALGFVSVNW